MTALLLLWLALTPGPGSAPSLDDVNPGLPPTPPVRHFYFDVDYGTQALMNQFLFADRSHITYSGFGDKLLPLHGGQWESDVVIT